ncbi:MAG: hypothetical protein FHK82_09935 [Sedimenticola thiotaurini]|uniref:STAS/SEC14 domain-containing protein n=1 Tax=Sedimenticola thiotaurini TaxID=1543721 RepID=A0A558D0J9_9GAMM|nr:MAG: hypothetical protein FHK82_09935 [Sedimenticola thiotaurini]
MAYKLIFEEEGNYLTVTVEGSRTHADPVKSGQMVVDKVFEKCKASGHTRVMLVSHLTGNYPPFANYQVVSSLEQVGVPKEWRLAYVNLDQASHTAIMFSETLAVKKGFQARVFENEQEARDWLNG